MFFHKQKTDTLSDRVDSCYISCNSVDTICHHAINDRQQNINLPAGLMFTGRSQQYVMWSRGNEKEPSGW